MKLTTKLLLAFSTTILLIMLITVLSWKATATFDRQKTGSCRLRKHYLIHFKSG